MRHRMKGKQLGRDTGERNALRKALTLALFEHGRIKTTRAKADFVRGFAERLITIAKRGHKDALDDATRVQHAQKLIASRLYNRRDVAQKIYHEIAPRFDGREGGYTRILKLGPRKGDASDMVFLELVDYEVEA